MAAVTSLYIHLKMAAIISEYINLKMAAIISDFSIVVKWLLLFKIIFMYKIAAIISDLSVKYYCKMSAIISVL